MFAISNYDVRLLLHLVFSLAVATAVSVGAMVKYKRSDQLHFGKIGIGIMAVIVWAVVFFVDYFIPHRGI